MSCVRRSSRTLSSVRCCRLSAAWYFFSSLLKYCFFSSFRRFSTSASLTLTPRSSAFCSNSIRWTRALIASPRSVVYSFVPAFGHDGCCAQYCSITWSNSSLVIVSLPTMATAPAGTDLLPLPQPAASATPARATARSGRMRYFIMKRAPLQGFPSRCAARFEYSIDQPERFWEAVVLNRNFISAGREPVLDPHREAEARPARGGLPRFPRRALDRRAARRGKRGSP